MPAWRSPAPPRCTRADADYHESPPGFERHLTCASTENLSPKCKVVSESAAHTLAVCCAPWDWTGASAWNGWFEDNQQNGTFIGGLDVASW